MHKKAVLFIVLIFGLHSHILAQEFNTVVFTSEDGLPDNYIYTLGRYNNACLWVGTSSGLAIFDGYQIDTISSVKQKNNPFVTSQAIDGNGELWIGFYDGSIGKIENNQIKTIIPAHEDWGKISNIVFDSTSNSILALSVYGSLIKINEKDTQIVGVDIPEPLQDLKCNSHGIFIRNNEGVYKYNLKKFESEEVLAEAVLDFDLSGHKLIFSNEKGLYQYLLKDQALESFNIPTQILEGKCDQVYIKDGKAFVLHKGKGISILYLQSGKANSFNFSNQSGLPDLNYQNIFVDDEAIIWLGTYGEGVVKAELALFNVIETNFEHPITTIHKDDSNRIWVASNNKLYQQDQKLIKSEKLKLILDFEDKITTISSFLNDIWLGTEGSGVIILNTETKEIISLNVEQGFFSNKITNIYNDDKGHIYIASIDNGFIAIDSLGRTHFNTSNGLLHNYVLSSLLDHSNRLWFSMHRTSLSYLDLDSNKFTILKPKGINFGLEINGISQDKDSSIWLASNGNGLLKYNDEDFSWIGTGKAKLQSNFCYSIFPDAYHNLWVSHKEGFSVLDIKENTSILFGAEDGFPVGSKSTNSFIELDNSSILALSEQNMVAINSELIVNEPELPVIKINKLRVNGQGVDVGIKDHKLKFGDYSYAFNFTGISLKKGSPIKYKYKIEGLDDNWSNLTEERQIRFSLNHSGDYVFKLKAINAYEVESEVYEFKISIASPFYFSWWFILLSIITIIGLPLYYFYQKIKNTEESRLILEVKVKERTEELLKKSIEIEKQKDELADSKAKIEKIHRDVTDNINYAKSIQESLLASEDIKYSNLSGSFIFFKPKDQVSGDFYYIKKFGKNLVISAADCTGHGVSGAILTVLGITYLHEIVSREDIFDPGIALDQLREKIKATYKTFGSERKDGLDIALCILDTESNLLSYSGAFNPLWLVRNKELIEFKATRNPIGVYYDEKPFKTHNIQLQKEDSFYIFSDGFPDQFGGPKGKKFKYKPFKKLLVRNSDKNMDEQYAILEETFIRWKSDLDQTDDVTLLGIKV